MANTRPPIPSEDRPKALDALGYEVSMFCACSVALHSSSGPATNEPWWFVLVNQNGPLEGLALKARLLHDFFYRDLPKLRAQNESDLRALDFNADWEFPDEAAWENARVWANKHLAHLTVERLSDKPAWPITEITRAVLVTFRKFIEEVKPDMAASDGRLRNAVAHADDVFLWLPPPDEA